MIYVDMESGRWEHPQPGQEQKKLRFLAVGDVCPASGRRYDEILSAGPEAASAAYGDLLGELTWKDLSLGNLELPLAEGGQAIVKCGPNLIGPPGAIEGVKIGGFDVLKMANNHVLDYGPGPLMDTIELVAENGMATVGAGGNLEEASRPLFIERAGFRVGMLAFAENEFSGAGRDEPGCCPLDPGPNRSAIRKAAGQCDLLIVCVHGGSELCPLPSPRMVRDYRCFVDAGADAVIGDHAHTVQGMELYRDVPIIYNLGNFFFWADPEKVSPQWWKRMFVRLTFNGRRCIRLDVHPFEVDFATAALKLLEGREKRRFLENLNRLSEIIADPDLHEQFWNAYCMSRREYYTGHLERSLAGITGGKADEAEAARLRHLFSCEAHKDVITGFAELIRQGRADEAFGVEEALARLMS